MNKKAVQVLLTTDKHRGYAFEAYARLCELTHQMELKLTMKTQFMGGCGSDNFPDPMKDKLNREEIEDLFRLLHEVDVQLAELSETIANWRETVFEVYGIE